ncbi:hypothetical protein AB7Z50_17535 [Providencia rettgeri]|uniref:hypothetical protein n=1 Tax=Providencia huaxiensis TaxID=2027290 RepID=UPI001EE7AC5C|nr:hypothetical protein [Providencia huaxiensis]
MKSFNPATSPCAAKLLADTFPRSTFKFFELLSTVQAMSVISPVKLIVPEAKTVGADVTAKATPITARDFLEYS